MLAGAPGRERQSSVFVCVCVCRGGGGPRSLSWTQREGEGSRAPQKSEEAAWCTCLRKLNFHSKRSPN